jgi:hydroxyethylthiazole kinase-like uncharacterized protein yjeF
MQRAAHALAVRIRSLVASRRPERGEHFAGRVLLLIGSGDNGGDALFVGALLADGDIEVLAVSTGSRMHPAGSEAAERAGVALLRGPESEAVLDGVVDGSLEVDVIVDGMLGIGADASTGLRGEARHVVERLRSASALPAVVAVDLPSGIDPDSGATADDVVLPATLTVTFGGVKAGLLRGRGAELAGEVVLVDIGIGADLAAVDPVVPAATVARVAPAPPVAP